jgi:transposase
MNEHTSRKAYPSDLNDAQWEILEPLLPHLTRRDVPWSIHAARSSTHFCTCCAPAVLGVSSPMICRPGKPSTGSGTRWQNDGTWPRLLRLLRRRARQQVGRDPELKPRRSSTVKASVPVPSEAPSVATTGGKKFGEAFAICSLIRHQLALSRQGACRR